MKKAPLYTFSGDQGLTSLVGGERVSKDDVRVEAYGTIDELNALLGIVRVSLEDSSLKEELQTIQNHLFSIGARLADSSSPTLSPLPEEQITALERAIDRLYNPLPPLHQFIFPGGTFPSAYANLARTLCRRAERRIVTLSKTTFCDASILKYINRLSDYLFALSRSLNVEEEKKWENTCK